MSSFAIDSGYTPSTFNQLMEMAREGVNTQFGTSYTTESFVGTNFYKLYYAPLQHIQENETKTSEIFHKAQEYITETNQRIQRPSVSAPGIVDAFASDGYVVSVKPPAEVDAGTTSIAVKIDEDTAGTKATGWIKVTDYAQIVSSSDDTVTVGATVFTASGSGVSPGDATFQAASSNDATAASLAAQINAHATAGALVFARAFSNVVRIDALQSGTAGNSIALAYSDENPTSVGIELSDANLEGGTDPSGDYAEERLAVATKVKDSVALGIVSLGTEEEEITLSNGQQFSFKFFLPYRIPTVFRLTLTTSENNLLAIPDDEDLRQTVFDNINLRYRMGWNLEPQRYFNLSDALWAQTALLEYSFDDGDTYSSAVYETDFRDLITFGLEDIEVLIDP